MHRGSIAVALLCLVGGVQAADLRGQVELTSGGKPLRASEATDAVVYYRPREPVALTPPAEPAVLTTRRKQFLPRVLAVQAGTTVRFPNEDYILHNAFSTSPGNVFDTGAYASGEGATHRFDQPGLVKVYCNVHHSMAAHILVLDTPWFTRPDAQGRFVLSGLPDTAGELVVFHDRTSPVQQTVTPGGEPVVVRVELTRRKVPPHMNKFGKPYGRSADAGNY